MARLNRTCVVCGTRYEYCSSCNKDRNKPTWMSSFHDENCKKIYEACAGFNSNRLTSQEAKEILDTCDLADKERFTTSTKRLIDEIYKVRESEEVVNEWDSTNNFTNMYGSPMMTETIHADNIKVNSASGLAIVNDMDVDTASATTAAVKEFPNTTSYKKRRNKKKKDN